MLLKIRLKYHLISHNRTFIKMIGKISKVKISKVKLPTVYQAYSIGLKFHSFCFRSYLKNKKGFPSGQCQVYKIAAHN